MQVAGTPSAIGMFASVLPDPVCAAASPLARRARSTARTSGSLSSTAPPGRAPMRRMLSAPSPPAAVRSAARTRRLRRSSEATSSERMSSSIVASGAIVFTDRPPRITPTFIVVFGFAPGAGISGSIAAIARARIAIAFGRP